MLFPHTKRLSLEGAQPVVKLGLRANWQQFTLLVIVNAFVGGMVGLERGVVPLLGHQVFGLASTTAVLSFIASFGIIKALANLFAGRLSDRIGRKGMIVGGMLLQGIAIGALLAGVLADFFGVSLAIGVIAGVTFLSGVVVFGVMRETLPRRPVAQIPPL